VLKKDLAIEFRAARSSHALFRRRVMIFSFAFVMEQGVPVDARLWAYGLPQRFSGRSRSRTFERERWRDAARAAAGARTRPGCMPEALDDPDDDRDGS
jgi:hypothetical protein